MIVVILVMTLYMNYLKCAMLSFHGLRNKYRLNNGHKCDMGFNIASAAMGIKACCLVSDRASSTAFLIIY